jgi:hypothetical protein
MDRHRAEAEPVTEQVRRAYGPGPGEPAEYVDPPLALVYVLAGLLAVGVVATAAVVIVLALEYVL